VQRAGKPPASRDPAQQHGKEVVFRAEEGFAKPEVCKALEAWSLTTRGTFGGGWCCGRIWSLTTCSSGW